MAVVLGSKPQTVHAAVHFQEHMLGGIGFVRGQPVNLGFVVHRVPQVQPRAPFQVPGFKTTFEHQDGTAPSQRADAGGFVKVEQGKSICTLQTFIRTLQAVAVGVGFDDGPTLRVGRSRLCSSQVVCQCVRMDQGMNRAGHGAVAWWMDWDRILPAPTTDTEFHSLRAINPALRETSTRAFQKV